MTRRELRENTFKMLFRSEFYPAEELAEQVTWYLDDVEDATGEEKRYLEERTNKIYGKLSELDEAINEVAEGWKTKRMSKVDLTLIRLALFEIRFDESVPEKVAINEAVELAKLYGGNESPAFINGILAKLVGKK